jgi:hypothetical protein
VTTATCRVTRTQMPPDLSNPAATSSRERLSLKRPLDK